MRIWPRFGTVVAVLGAALIGFQLGAARTAAASAEKDQANCQWYSPPPAQSRSLVVGS